MPSRRELIFGAFRRPTPSHGDAAAYLRDETRKVVAISEACLARSNVVCRTCGEACPEAAIRFSPRIGGAALPEVLSERCTGCGDCLSICPAAALSRVNSPALSSSPEELCA